ncbi:Asp23/Gls24 family envelope stress response protein [Collinsella sp. An268]|uniref:Asp23/Gls24 family envelope stress response protein n=1 Tax=Collinsella sp. An268 TaxID=1965612 RepID=UPI000B39B331|nr:Asp23/Gls24 family envelope stress response protein [Collinsella sp. An268]OUO64368.1 Asp23/Gls24 family envelope stress response protein [Collinsella sp. An268]
MAQEKELQASIETTGEAAAEDKDVLAEAAPDVAGEEPAGDDAAPEDVAADDAADDAEDEEYEDTEDSLTYSNGVIEKIVAMATREVPHVLGMKGNLIHFVQETLGAKDLTKGVTVEVTDDNRVIVNISVIIEYGCYAPAIFEDVKERVTERLAAMTGLEVAGINLRIEDVVTLEAYNASKKQAEAARENAA